LKDDQEAALYRNLGLCCGPPLISGRLHHPPVKTLVTRGLPKSEQFKKALTKQKIRVLFYNIDDRSDVEFVSLDDALNL
jgi:hypothetical protein